MKSIEITEEHLNIAKNYHHGLAFTHFSMSTNKAICYIKNPINGKDECYVLSGEGWRSSIDDKNLLMITSDFEPFDQTHFDHVTNKLIDLREKLHSADSRRSMYIRGITSMIYDLNKIIQYSRYDSEALLVVKGSDFVDHILHEYDSSIQNKHLIFDVGFNNFGCVNRSYFNTINLTDLNNAFNLYIQGTSK